MINDDVVGSEVFDLDGFERSAPGLNDLDGFDESTEGLA